LDAVRPRLEPALAQVQQLMQAEAEAQLLGQQGRKRQGQQEQQQQTAAAAAAAGWAGGGREAADFARPVKRAKA
jgi:hypothetical protein